MERFEDLPWGRSELMPPANSEEVAAVEQALRTTLPASHKALLAFADGGTVNDAFILYAAAAGVHPAERLVPANRRNGDECPLVVIGREATDEFGFRREDLRSGVKAPAVYFLSYETWDLTRAAGSLFEFLARVTALRPGGRIAGRRVRRDGVVGPSAREGFPVC